MKSRRRAQGLVLAVLAVAYGAGCGTEVIDVISRADAGKGPAGATAAVEPFPSAEAGVTAPRETPAATACVEEGEACTSSGECCTLLCDGAGPKGGRCVQPPGCSHEDKAHACTRQLGDSCATTADCCAGACTRSAGTALRCATSPVCAATCEVCATNADCCSGECRERHGSEKRCEPHN